MSQFDAIYDYVRTVPKGRVVSYGEVGQVTGEMARTVGWAMSLTPPDVPWQRVVGADGYLRIARRSAELAVLQRQLLEAEGVAFDANGCVERRFFLNEPDEAQGSLF